MNIDDTDLLAITKRATEQAAGTLAEMLEQEVQIRLFDVKQPGLSDLNRIVKEFSTDVAGVRLMFRGILSGHSYLLLPGGQIQQLTEITGDPFEAAKNEGNSAEIVLAEIGNVILNAVVGVLANQLDLRVSFEIPQVIRDAKDFEKDVRQIREVVAAARQPYLLTSQLVIQSFSIQMVILVIFFRAEG